MAMTGNITQFGSELFPLLQGSLLKFWSWTWLNYRKLITTRHGKPT